MDCIKDYSEQYAEYEAREAREDARFPECEYCEEKITGSYYYDIDGTILCPECVKNLYRKTNF